MRSSTAAKSCVIIVENLPVPFDRRVWQEAQALTEAGWIVSVICPASSQYSGRYEYLGGVHIYRHPLPLLGTGLLSYAIEYIFSLTCEFYLLLKIQRERGFHIIQACNPPDFIFLVIVLFKLFGKIFIFDQHDLVPELFSAKYQKRGVLYGLALLAEKCTYALADFVIVANESFKEVAMKRGGKSAASLEVVYSFPSFGWLPSPSIASRPHRAGKLVLGYLGVVAEQDGVDNLIHAVAIMRKLQFVDFSAVIVGDGPALHSVRELTQSLGVAEFIEFTGYLTGPALFERLSSFDVGVIPDPVNEANDVMSMNKVFEYCALGIPTAAYPLTETRRLLGGAGVYATRAGPEELADACLKLLQDDALRARCASEAKRLSADVFVWEREALKYVEVYERAYSLAFNPAALSITS